MNYRRRMLTRMGNADRIAVGLLRGETAGVATDVAIAFENFRQRLEEIGLRILEAGAVLVGDDEILILGWLAALQRRRLETALESWRIGLTEAEICASHLNHMGHRLDYRRAINSQNNEHFSAKLEESGVVTLPQDTSLSMLRLKLLDEMGRRGPMRTVELTAMGFSRQMLGSMVKRGQIRRIRYGLYGLPHK